MFLHLPFLVQIDSFLMYFVITQDPGTKPARRVWSSINVGTEIYVDAGVTAEWSVSDFDILVPESITDDGLSSY